MLYWLLELEGSASTSLSPAIPSEQPDSHAPVKGFIPSGFSKGNQGCFTESSLLAPTTSGSASSSPQDFALSTEHLWAAGWEPILTPHPSNHCVSPHRLSLARSKLCQWTLQALEQRSSFPFEKGESCLMPASLVPCRSSYCQKRLVPPFPCNLTARNWKEWGKNKVCPRFPH